MSEAVRLNEQSMLALLIKEPKLLIEVPKEFFIVDASKAIFDSVEELHRDNHLITARDLANLAHRKDGDIVLEHIEKLMSLDVSKEKFDFYYQNLRTDIIQHEIKEKTESLITTLHKRGTLEVDAVQRIISEIEEQVTKWEKANHGDILYDIEDAFSAYMQTLEDRYSGAFKKYSSGDSELDKLLLMRYSPGQIIALIGATGVGKSTKALNLLNKRINKGIPSLWMTFEMTLISTMDRLMALRTDTPIDFYYDGEGDLNVWEEQKRLIEVERSILGGNNKLLIVEKSGLWLDDVRRIIRSAKKRMETDYLVVTLDLGTMIEDFNKGESSGRSYEKAMNKLSDISKEENVCFEFLAQFGQEADDPRGVKEVTDIFTKMKPKAN
jgi:replicative DNA helicase